MRNWSFTDWPLMDGRLVPPFDADGALAMFAHRVLACSDSRSCCGR